MYFMYLLFIILESSDSDSSLDKKIKKTAQDKKKLSSKPPQPATKVTSANESSSSGKVSRGRGRPRKYPVPEPTKNGSNINSNSKSSQDKKLVTTRGSTRVSRILAASHRTTTATDSDSDTGIILNASVTKIVRFDKCKV